MAVRLARLCARPCPAVRQLDKFIEIESGLEDDELYFIDHELAFYKSTDYWRDVEMQYNYRLKGFKETIAKYKK